MSLWSVRLVQSSSDLWAPFLQWPVYTCTDITHYIPHTPTYLRHTPAWPLTSARDSPGLSPLTIFPNLFVSEVNILGKAWLFIGLRSGLASGAGARGERRFWMPNVIAEWVSSMRYLHRSLSPGPSISWGIVIRELCIIMIRRWPPVTMFPAIAGVTQAFWYVLLGSEDDLKAGAECDIIRGIALSVCSHKIKGLKNTSTLFCLLLMRDDLQKCTEKRRFIWTRLLKPFFTTKKLDTSFEKAILSSMWAQWRNLYQ